LKSFKMKTVQTVRLNKTKKILTPKIAKVTQTAKTLTVHKTLKLRMMKRSLILTKL